MVWIVPVVRDILVCVVGGLYGEHPLSVDVRDEDLRECKEVGEMRKLRRESDRQENLNSMIVMI